MTTNVDTNKIVKAYIKLRDQKQALQREADEKIAAVQEKIDRLSTALLDVCKATGQDGGKTQAGSFRRSVKTRYEATNWEKMHEFIRQHDDLDLLEHRIHQKNMATFLQEHPNALPEGLNINSSYAITVTRART